MEKEFKEEKNADIIMGREQTSCLVSCSSTDINTVFLDVKVDKFRNCSKIDLAFSDKVLVTFFDFPKFSAAEFLSRIGGSLGLWLGLGVVQIISVIINSGVRIKN